jgi:glucans biosynthesis protein
MFIFDATNQITFDDFRSAVHDSDGLKIQQANGETIWRPLANPSQLQVSSFGKTKPTGFGLLQRHREFAQYQDAEARYDKRASLWIEPQEDWGEGEVVLVEIPSQEEINDNIVAFWQPTDGLKAGESNRYAYTMSWGNEPGATLAGRVLETAVGAVNGSDERLFVIDFSNGDSIKGVMSDPNAVSINMFSSAGEITDVSSTLVEVTGNYRVYMKFDPADVDLAELRVALEVNGNPWGETWLYRWSR